MADLKATISAVWTGKQATNQATKDIDDLSSGAKKSGTRFKELGAQAAVAGGVLAATGLAAKAAYDYIGEGAELSAAAGKFDNLSVSINTTGDTLLGKMRDATKGMISDADLVASGTDIMSLGLAKTETGVVRMASAVGALNLDMQVLALTLANDSTARLDNLGLSLEAVTAKKKELIASGFIGDAFDEAVLIELEKKMQLLGDASQTTAGKMQIMETSLMNVSDNAKIIAVDIAAIPISDLSEDVVEFASDLQNLATVMTIVSESDNKFVEGIVTATDKTREIALAVHPLSVGLRLMGHNWDNATDAISDYLMVAEDAAQSATTADSIMLDYGMTLEEIEELTLANADALHQQAVAFVTGIETSGNYADSLYDVEAAEKATAEAAAAAAVTIAGRVADYQSMTGAMSGVSGAITAAFGKDALAELDEAQGEWVTVTTNNASRIADVNSQLNSDLDSDQKKHFQDVLSNTEEGGAEWVAAYEAIQADMSDTQRQELIIRRNELEEASGQVRSVFTGDAEALEEASARQIAANEAIMESYNNVALAIVDSGLQQTIGESGEDAETAALGYIAMQEAMGTITDEEAMQLQQVALETLAIKTATEEMTAEFLEDGILTRAEAVLIAEKIKEISSAVQEIPKEYVVTFRSDTTYWNPPDAGWQGASGGFQGPGGESAPQNRATGGSNLVGGSYMVGEAGAEMVTLPAGSSVTNAQDYSSMVNNFNGVNPSVIMRQQQIQRRRAR